MTEDQKKIRKKVHEACHDIMAVILCCSRNEAEAIDALWALHNDLKKCMSEYYAEESKRVVRPKSRQ